MKKLHVATSALTNTIYCGTVLKDGMTWGANKTEVTGQACAAVAQHCLSYGKPVIVNENGVPKYEITAIDLSKVKAVDYLLCDGDCDD